MPSKNSRLKESGLRTGRDSTFWKFSTGSKAFKGHSQEGNRLFNRPRQLPRITRLNRVTTRIYFQLLLFIEKVAGYITKSCSGFKTVPGRSSLDAFRLSRNIV